MAIKNNYSDRQSLENYKVLNQHVEDNNVQNSRFTKLRNVINLMSMSATRDKMILKVCPLLVSLNYCIIKS